MGTKTNAEKTAQLGMPYGTASNRLRKILFFNLLKEFGRNICFRCGTEISSSKNLSVEHKKPWYNKDPKLFWDLSNIAYSHLSCNIATASTDNFRNDRGPTGTSYCHKCKRYLPNKEFSKKNSRWNKLQRQCKLCRHTAYLKTGR